MTANLVLDCVIGAPSRPRQIHLLRDPNNNSLRDQTAHISLITQLAFRDRGALYCTGTDDKPPHDWRVPHTPFLVSDQLGELERGKYFATIAVIQTPAAIADIPVSSPVENSTTRHLRNRCVTDYCNLVQCPAAQKAQMLLCAECYDEEVTRAHNASLPTAAPAPSTTDLPIPQEVPVVNTYAMAWTDGGCRDVTVGKKNSAM